MRRIFCASVVLAAVGSVSGQSMPAGQGAPYKAPAGDLKREVLWAWQCEEPDGQGLAFSGQSQAADDGQPHTRIKDGDAWRPIVDELRKANPLQRCHDQAWAVRTAMKDILTRERFRFFEGRLDQRSDNLARLKDMKSLIDALSSLDMNLQAHAPARVWTLFECTLRETIRPAWVWAITRQGRSPLPSYTWVSC